MEAKGLAPTLNLPVIEHHLVDLIVLCALQELPVLLVLLKVQDLLGVVLPELQGAALLLPGLDLPIEPRPDIISRLPESLKPGPTLRAPPNNELIVSAFEALQCLLELILALVEVFGDAPLLAPAVALV